MRPARRFASNLAAVSGIFLVSTAFAGIPYIETWDDPVLGSHNWYYWMEIPPPQPPAPPPDASHLVPWVSQPPGGYVGLANLSQLTKRQNCYAPFFTHNDTRDRDRSQDLYLTPDTTISVDMGLVGWSGGGGLGWGNSIYFVIGEHQPGHGNKFWRREYPMSPPKSEWHEAFQVYTFLVGDETDWVVFHHYDNPDDPATFDPPLSAQWNNPQQYAFAIIGDNLTTDYAPGNVDLWMDNFKVEVIPEASAAPWVFALSALGFACLRRLGR